MSDEGVCACGNPNCPGGSLQPTKIPGFFKTCARTIAFDAGRRLVAWAVPGAVVMMGAPEKFEDKLVKAMDEKRKAAEEAKTDSDNPGGQKYL